METLVLMLFCIRQDYLTLFTTLYIIMAQPVMVSMKKLPTLLNACNTSTFLKIYCHSNSILLTHYVLLTKWLITSSYVKGKVRKTIKRIMLTLTSSLIKMYHSKSSEKPSVKILNGENRAFCNAFLGYLNNVKSLNYLTKMCFNILKIVFQNFRLIHRKLTVFSFISKLVRKACELSKMRKCSSFSRAPSISLLRMSQIHFRFGQKYVFYSSFFAFLRRTSDRTDKIYKPKSRENYAVTSYQVFFKFFNGFRAKISMSLSETFRSQSFGPESLQKVSVTPLKH